MIFDPYLQESNPIIQEASGFSGPNIMHSRHPTFRMPEWMSEDDDVSNLASRMSHGPQWMFGNRGQRRDMQNPTDNDITNRSEAVAHTIPIRIEAEAPPGCMPQQNDVPLADKSIPEVVEPSPTPDKINPEMLIGNQPAYASKTTPTVDSCVQEEVPRDSRSSSAPPDVKDKEVESPRYISKINITPQQPQSNSNHTFNNLATPFTTGTGSEGNVPVDVVDNSKVHPTSSVNSNIPDKNKMAQDQQYAQGPNTSSQKTSVIRNIPILFEGHNDNTDNSRSTPPPTVHHNQQRGPNWNQQFGNMPDRFHDEMFNDPFFGFNRFDNHMPQRQGQHMPNEFSQREFSHPEPPQKESQQVFTQQPAHAPPRQEFNDRQPPMEKPPKDNFVEVKVNKEPVEKQQPKDIQMEKIKQVRNSFSKFQKEVEMSNITEKTKEYRYLDEMLTRSLLELDNIDVTGRDDLRQTRRALIRDINASIALLERKKSIPSDNVESMDTSKSKEPSPEPTLCQDSKKTKIDVSAEDKPEISANNKSQANTNGVNVIEAKINNEENGKLKT